MAGSSAAMTPSYGVASLDQNQSPNHRRCFNGLPTKEAVMRRPFLVPLSIAVILIVLMLGFEAASRPWGMMGPGAWSGPWGFGPPMMHGTMMRGYGPPPWSQWSSARDLNLTADAVKA